MELAEAKRTCQRSVGFGTGGYHICIYIHTYIYIHIYIYIHCVYIYLYVYRYIYLCVYVIHLCVVVHIYIYIHTYVHTYMRCCGSQMFKNFTDGKMTLHEKTTTVTTKSDATTTIVIRTNKYNRCSTPTTQGHR